MKNCANCFWCRYSLDIEHTWKCKLYPKKRFNFNKLHGLFCKQFVNKYKVKYKHW